MVAEATAERVEILDILKKLGDKLNAITDYTIDEKMAFMSSLWINGYLELHITEKDTAETVSQMIISRFLNYMSENKKYV